MIVAGIDEAGRGCLAGPVVAAAIIFKDTSAADIGINDSKLLTPAKREELYDIIISHALSWAVAFVDNKRIDKVNILNATFEAMNKAVSKLNVEPDHLLIDGNRFRGSYLPYSTIIGGDGISISIAAASILAKVERDRYMIKKAHKKYPQYFFDKNKGYGTKQHFEMLRKFGYCDLHRATFLKKGKSKQLQLFSDQKILYICFLKFFTIVKMIVYLEFYKYLYYNVLYIE